MNHALSRKLGVFSFVILTVFTASATHAKNFFDLGEQVEPDWWGYDTGKSWQEAVKEKKVDLNQARFEFLNKKTVPVIILVGSKPNAISTWTRPVSVENPTDKYMLMKRSQDDDKGPIRTIVGPGQFVAIFSPPSFSGSFKLSLAVLDYDAATSAKLGGAKSAQILQELDDKQSYVSAFEIDVNEKQTAFLTFKQSIHEGRLKGLRGLARVYPQTGTRWGFSGQTHSGNSNRNNIKEEQIRRAELKDVISQFNTQSGN